MTFGPHGDPFGGAPFGQFPGGPQQPYGGPPIVTEPPPPAEMNTLATLSLIFAFVFAPAGAVLGHLGLAQIKRTGQRGRDRALIGVVLSYVFIVAAVVALVVWAVRPAPSETAAESGTSVATPPTSASSPAAPPPPLVTRAQLPNLPLSLDDVKRLMPNLDETYTATDTSDELNGSPGVATVPESCRPALFAGASEVYANSAGMATFSRSVTSPDVDTLLKSGGVEERVMLYPNAAAAQAQADALEKLWQGCVGALTQTLDYGRGTVRYQVDPVSRAPGDPSIVMLKATMIEGPRGLDGIRNVRAIAAKSNVLIDLVVFSQNPGSSAEDITAAILARIPG
ncbi:PknJ protein [Mycolicibacterium mageritense DSM 44476 = CIP 104973]|uniref:DUF4190 domain-containing protein n=1 Tax=Mycolicibacterium mageritense TaxID=53462 RepID=A0ABN5Y5T9_MYCME|nr:sensor domain-containing protein [Mycolicibacterium mageritense]MCC9185057.1 sensor domain-containing protein [Mycolicibacterium mageritense]BBX33008.1 hypothetical protein MMAGJ_22900 [Mycolicibacterium mageritense]CDO21443.1 PknJ protein [Mycolicibacterium mageritense DSM 44476 = CIP 104973]